MGGTTRSEKRRKVKLAKRRNKLRVKGYIPKTKFDPHPERRG